MSHIDDLTGSLKLSTSTTILKTIVQNRKKPFIDDLHVFRQVEHACFLPFVSTSYLHHSAMGPLSAFEVMKVDDR
jgi:hypothetical protein